MTEYETPSEKPFYHLNQIQHPPRGNTQMEETTTHTKITIVLSLILATLLSPPTTAYSNGGYSADPTGPDYGTHDYIAQHALD